MTRPEGRTIHRCVLSDDPARRSLYVRGGSVESRTALSLASRERVTFDTYFGAIPASYWRAHTTVRTLRLSLRVRGQAEIEVRGTDAGGMASTVARISATDEVVGLDVPLARDAAWLWPVITAGPSGATVADVRWDADAVPADAARIAVAVTTFDREGDCIRLLASLAESGCLARIDSIVVTDQGTRRLRDGEGFAEVERLLGTRLRVIVQPNLGGSGGFSRGMVEALATSSSHVLLLDDDVDLEPESLMRLADFADHAGGPTIVGAQMLSLVEPTRLHSFGERVSRRGFWWEPVEPRLSSCDLSGLTFEGAPALSRRIDVDFNGWWMCLVPMSLVRAIGASLPLFIKWDDAEFGLRAAANRVPTVTLPGAALWHMPWTAKDDGLDWQAYFQLRNRIVTALLHGGPRGSGVLSSSFAQDVNHVLCAQYGSAAVRNQALRDVLQGPSHLDPVLYAGPARAARILAREGQVVVPAQDAPSADSGVIERPRGVAAKLLRVVRVAAHQMRRADATAAPLHLSRSAGKWWSLGRIDVAVVDAAAGNGVFVLRRDRSAMWRELRAAVWLRLRLWASWPRVSRQYRAEAARQASPAAWQSRFAQEPPRSAP